jgi:hypothetical protein
VTIHEEVPWLRSHILSPKISGNFVFFKEKWHSVVDFTHVIIRFNSQKSKRFHMVALR